MGYGSDNAPGTTQLKVGDEVRYIGTASPQLRERALRVIAADGKWVQVEENKGWRRDALFVLVKRPDPRDAELEGLKARVAELEELVDYLRRDRTSQDEVKTSIVAERDQLQARVAELEASYRGAKYDAERDGKKKETVLSGSKAALQVDKLKAENARLRAELEATREDLNNAMLERNRLAREVEALKPSKILIEVTVGIDQALAALTAKLGADK